MKRLNFSYAKTTTVKKFWRIVRLTQENPRVVLHVSSSYPHQVTIVIEWAGLKYALVTEFECDYDSRYGRTTMKNEYAVRLHPDYNK